VVSRLKRVRFGPVFLTSDLSVGRWREMVQSEVDILSGEVGLLPVALPEMKVKIREKLERLQRKSPKPVVPRSPRRPEGERPARVLRDENGVPIARKPRPSTSRDSGDANKGTPLAERPGDVNKKRPGKPSTERSGTPAGERPARKPPAGKRPSPSDGQRPGFGRKRP
jgi:23S rRNA pseudouridine2605 synthase